MDVVDTSRKVDEERTGQGVVDPDMEEMLRHMEPGVLIGSAKRLENFEAQQKIARDRLYEESKGCEKI